MFKVQSLLALALSLASLGAQAGWTLDGEASSLSFVSVKAGTAAETHHFNTLSGQVDDDGTAVIMIEAASVDTGIEIRDERMRSLLLQSEEYPSLRVAAQVDLAAVEALAAGASKDMAAEAMLSIRAQELNLTLQIRVARLGDDRLLVTSLQPVIVNAGQIGLLDGIERLREVAGLPSITPAVPVSFVLMFERDGQGPEMAALP